MLELGRVGDRAVWHAGFIFLCGTAPLVSFLSKLHRLVVSWGFDGQAVVFRCLLRRNAVRLPIGDITEVVELKNPGRVYGCVVRSMGVPSLEIHYSLLGDGSQLAQFLDPQRVAGRGGVVPAEQPAPSPIKEASKLDDAHCRELSGAVPTGDIVIELFMDGIATFFLGCPLVVGLAMAGIGISGKEGLFILLPAGLVLSLACVICLQYVGEGPNWVVVDLAGHGRIRVQSHHVTEL